MNHDQAFHFHCWNLSVEVEPLLQMTPGSSPFPSPPKVPIKEQQFSPVSLIVNSVTLGHDPMGVD